MNRNTILLKLTIVCTIVGLTCTSCKKFLDEKSNKSVVVASTIGDAQALVDYYTRMNLQGISVAGNYMDDDYYVTDTYYNTMSAYRQLFAIWDPKAVDADANWQAIYQSIATTNVALETLEKINPSTNELAAYNQAKGAALVFRAIFHHELAIIFAPSYKSSSASQDLGIPYKTSSDVNDPTVRISNRETYNDIVEDLKLAASILPANVSPVSRPSKIAALGMLARVYLSMSDFDQAGKYADSALKLNSTLMDYNDFFPYSTTSTTSPFPTFNKEDIFHTCGQGAGLFGSKNWICDSLLYKSYDQNDLRKALFFAKTTLGPNTYCFRGSYDRLYPGNPYAGIATDELFLIRAECQARKGNIAGAMADLNSLLQTRWKTGTSPNLQAQTSAEAVQIVLRERRKELVQRCNMRFMDLKRLNLESNLAVTIRRTVKGTSYTLPPNDLRYQLLIPVTVIQSSGIPQNPR